MRGQVRSGGFGWLPDGGEGDTPGGGGRGLGFFEASVVGLWAKERGGAGRIRAATPPAQRSGAVQKRG
jgi:hypothetical protein